MDRQSKAQASRVNIAKYVEVATAKGERWRFCRSVARSSNGRSPRTAFRSMGERNFTRSAAERKEQSAARRSP